MFALQAPKLIVGEPQQFRRFFLMKSCLGVAWFRFIVVIVTIFSGLWPMIILYALAAMVMKPEPVRPLNTEAERDFYDDYVQSRHSAARRMKRRYDHLERRLRRMENTVTAEDFDWNRRMGTP